MPAHAVLSVDDRRAAALGLLDAVDALRFEGRPDQGSLDALARRGCLRHEGLVGVPDALDGSGLAAALCAGAMEEVGAEIGSRGRLIYRGPDGAVRVARLARLDVDPEPVGTMGAYVAMAA